LSTQKNLREAVEDGMSFMISSEKGIDVLYSGQVYGSAKYKNGKKISQTKTYILEPDGKEELPKRFKKKGARRYKKMKFVPIVTSLACKNSRGDYYLQETNLPYFNLEPLRISRMEVLQRSLSDLDFEQIGGALKLDL